MKALKRPSIHLNQAFNTKEEAIRFCGEQLWKADCIEKDYIDAMIERNNDVSVYMGNFIAIPHGTEEAKKYVKQSGMCLVQVPEGVNFGTEEEPQIATVLFGIAGVGEEHLQLIQHIALFCSDVDNVVYLADAQTEDDILERLSMNEEEQA